MDEPYGQAGDVTIKGVNRVFAGSGDDEVDGRTPGQTNDGDREVLDRDDGTDTAHHAVG